MLRWSARIRQAGAIVVGKNNLVEMSFGLTGDNNPYGQVKNPRAPDRVSGGVFEWVCGSRRRWHRARSIRRRHHRFDPGAGIVVRRG